MAEDSITGPGSSARLEAVWRDAQVNRRQFMAHQLTPLMRALVMSAFAGYALFLAGTQWVGPNAFPMWPKLLVLLALLLVSMSTLPASFDRYVTLAGWASLALLQVGILLAGLYTAEAFDWLLSAFLVIILGTSPTWMNTRDFVIAMLLSFSGPLAAMWLLQPSPQVLMQLGVFLIIALGVAIVVHLFMQRQLNAQWLLQQKLAMIASTDMLTGITNRMHFFALGNRKVHSAHERGLPLCALYIDVDHFKRINDDFGHATGDDALVAVATALQSRLRQGDVLGRVGGEEFAMLLPATGLDHATQVAERLRSAVERLDLSCGRLTISVGVAMLRRDDQAVNGLLAAADHALRRAKQAGRNRVEVAQARPHRENALHLVGKGESDS